MLVVNCHRFKGDVDEKSKHGDDDCDDDDDYCLELHPVTETHTYIVQQI